MSVLLLIFENPVLKAFLKGWNLRCRYFKLDTDVNEFNKFNKVVKVNPSLKSFWEKNWTKVKHPKWPRIHVHAILLLQTFGGRAPNAEGIDPEVAVVMPTASQTLGIRWYCPVPLSRPLNLPVQRRIKFCASFCIWSNGQVMKVLTMKHLGSWLLNLVMLLS